jgi:phosphoacetylglucosamine mutase
MKAKQESMQQLLQLDRQALMAAAVKYPKPQDVTPQYGTAGFRDKAERMESTTLRCGIIAGLRALQQRKSVGLMITASHNPEPDNGVKLVDPDGVYDFAQLNPMRAKC